MAEIVGATRRVAPTPAGAVWRVSTGELLRQESVVSANGRTIRALALILAIVMFAGCESAEKYKKVPAADSTAAPRVGTLEVTGSPAQMQEVKSLAQKMEAAKAQWDTGNQADAIGTVDSLCLVAEAALDTVPLGKPVTNFLLVYVTDSYEHLIAWQKEREDDKAVEALNHRFESLATRLQKRRDSTAATKTP